jgi:HTH-type transcriptional regulator/antitoxin HipB
MQNTRTIDQVQDELIGKIGTPERDEYERKLANDIFRREIGAKLSEIRKERGMTVEGLAERIGMKKSTVASIEAGKWGMSIDHIRLLKEALGFDIVFEI